MLLITYSFKKPQNFDLLQSFLHNEFSDNYVKYCTDFFVCGRKSTEISFLFLEKEMHIFYSIPKCDEYDIVCFDKPCNVKEFMLKLHNIFEGDIDLSAHLSYNNIKCPKKYLFFYLPQEFKTDDRDVLDLFENDDFSPSCSLYTSPHDSKEIQFVLNTYDEFQASIINVIDGTNKEDFIPRFFALVSLLMNGR